MPLTPAHAAAVVPFSRWKSYFWLSPLAVGSMAPDFLYYVFPPREWRHFGHTFWGLLLFSVPAGLAVLYAFHRIFKRPLVLLLPRPIRARLWPHCGPFPLLPLRRLAWICLLIYFGAVTHVAWDYYTHEDGDGPQLSGVVMTIAGHEVHWAGVLQDGSSLLGLGLLAWWSWRWYRRAPAGRVPVDAMFLRQARPSIAAAIIGFGAGVATVYGLKCACIPGPFSVREFVAAGFIAGVDAFAFALLVFAAAAKLRGWSAATGAVARQLSADRNLLLRDLSGHPRKQKRPELGGVDGHRAPDIDTPMPAGRV